MLYLKEINPEDIEEEYNFTKKMPKNDNGFENQYHDVSKEDFQNKIIPTLINNSKDLDLPKDYVPSTYYYLWDDNKIVGLFKIRHYLNDYLKEGAGHIGYGILPECRGKGYASKGLALAIEKELEIIKEDEIYMSVSKSNPYSLRVQLNNGAYIASENEYKFLTRIKPQDHKINFVFRDLQRNDWKRITSKTVTIKNLKTDYFEGKACLLYIKEITEPLLVNSPAGKICIADKDYKHLLIAPRNQNWWLTIMFDNDDKLIESYFDITQSNVFNVEENPYFIDMKLDVCIPPEIGPKLMDEDELKEIYEKGLITKEDYNKAYETANQIIEFYNNHQEEYYKYILELYNQLKYSQNSNNILQ